MSLSGQRVSKCDSDKKYQRVTNVVEAELDGHKVVMSIDTGLYLEIGGAGKKIWEILENKRSLDQIVEILVESYVIEPDLCRQQTTEYIDQLLKQHLIELSASQSPL